MNEMNTDFLIDNGLNAVILSNPFSWSLVVIVVVHCLCNTTRVVEEF